MRMRRYTQLIVCIPIRISSRVCTVHGNTSRPNWITWCHTHRTMLSAQWWAMINKIMPAVSAVLFHYVFLWQLIAFKHNRLTLLCCIWLLRTDIRLTYWAHYRIKITWCVFHVRKSGHTNEADNFVCVWIWITPHPLKHFCERWTGCCKWLRSVRANYSTFTERENLLHMNIEHTSRHRHTHWSGMNISNYGLTLSTDRVFWFKRFKCKIAECQKINRI